MGVNDDFIGRPIARPLPLCSPSPLHVLTCCSIVLIDVFVFPPSYLSFINQKGMPFFHLAQFLFPTRLTKSQQALFTAK